MDMSLFNLATTVSMGKRYMIVDGPRVGQVLPGSMVERSGGLPRENMIEMNPPVGPGDMVLPMRMHESKAKFGVVDSVNAATRSIAVNVDGSIMYGVKEWVVLPTIPEDELPLFLLQIREHLVLEGFERESRRRDWSGDWGVVQRDAGFAPRVAPTLATIRARWRIGLSDMSSTMQEELLSKVQQESDGVAIAHITTEHEVWLPNETATCSCTTRRRDAGGIGNPVQGGAVFREVVAALEGRMPNSLRLHEIEVRQIGCPYGIAY